MQVKPVSNNAIRRLPIYMRKLDELRNNDVERISSEELGDILGISSSRIRQDLSSFGRFGTRGYGFNVSQLDREIRNVMGVDRRFPAVLVGAGKIGRALLENFDFAACGFEMLAVFDKQCEDKPAAPGGVTVHPVEELPDYILEHCVKAAVLCVPRPAARPTAQTLVDCGVRAIWNFTDEDLYLPVSVCVENVHFSDSLLTIGYRINERK